MARNYTSYKPPVQIGVPGIRMSGRLTIGQDVRIAVMSTPKPPPPVQRNLQQNPTQSTGCSLGNAPNATRQSRSDSTLPDAPNVTHRSRSNSTLLDASDVQIGKLERELENTKSKGHALKDKLQNLRQVEIQRLTEKLDFHMKLSETSRLSQCMKMIRMHFGRATSEYRGEVFGAWRQVVADDKQKKLQALTKGKLDKLRKVSLLAFSSRSRWMTLSYVIQIWIVYTADEKLSKREMQRSVETLALKMKNASSSKNALLFMLQKSDVSSLALHFSQWKGHARKCRAEKVMNKAQQQVVSLKARYDTVKRKHVFVLAKWAGRSKFQMILGSWRRLAADNKLHRRADAFQAEVKKLKLISIPLLLATVQVESKKKWKAQSSANLVKMISTQVARRQKVHNSLIIVLSFHAWHHDSRAARFSTIIDQLNTSMHRQSQICEDQVIATRNSITYEMSVREEERRIADEKERHQLEEALERMARIHKEEFESLNDQHRQRLHQVEERGKAKLRESVCALEKNIFQAKEQGLDAKNKLQEAHCIEIARLEEKFLVEKIKLAENSKREHKRNTEHLTTRLAKSEAEAKEIKTSSDELKASVLEMIAERDAAKKELDMYQIEYRQLFRQFSTYQERGEELDKIQKADIASLEQYIQSHHAPASSKSILGRPIQIGDSYVSNGQLVPFFNKNPVPDGMLSPRLSPRSLKSSSVYRFPSPRNTSFIVPLVAGPIYGGVSPWTPRPGDTRGASPERHDTSAR